MVAQYPIAQFRIVGWTNAAAGIGVMLLQLAIFREHIRCKKINPPSPLKTLVHDVDRKPIHCFGVFVSLL